MMWRWCMATLQDVARRAGVTAATVSNVLTGRVGVQAATRQRVLAAIDAVGYRPNLVARGLAGGKTFTLAVVVPSLANPFFAEVVETMEAVADAEAYQLLLGLSHGDPHHGARHLERLASRWVDGYIIMGGAAPTTVVRTLVATGKPVVLSVWGTDAAGLDVPCVDIDFRQAGTIATQHLLDRGHQRIATILELPVQFTRLDGYQATLQGAGISVDPAFVRSGDSSFASGYREARALLGMVPRPTAIFAGNDAMALGVLKAAEYLGMAVPAEVAVVGVDDIPAAAYAHPPLTTVHIPTQELARLTVALLFRRMAGETLSTPPLLATHLVLRTST